MSFPAKPVAPLGIVEIIKKLHPKKAPGHDFITNEPVKRLTKKTYPLYRLHLQLVT